MVAENMDDIGISESIGTKQLDYSHPVFIACCVVNSIACLYTEIIVAFIQLSHDCLYLCEIFCLDIAEHEEFNFSVAVICLECILIGPLCAVTDLINISRVYSESRDDDAVYAHHGICASCESKSCTVCINCCPCTGTCFLISEHLCLCFGICKPCDIVFESAVL